MTTGCCHDPSLFCLRGYAYVAPQGPKWRRLIGLDGVPYYYNTATGASSWVPMNLHGTIQMLRKFGVVRGNGAVKGGGFGPKVRLRVRRDTKRGKPIKDEPDADVPGSATVLPCLTTATEVDIVIAHLGLVGGADPNEWDICYNEQGVPYYYNTSKAESVWQR